MLTPLNTIFVGRPWKRNIGKDGEGERGRRRDRQKDSQKDLVFSGFQLVWCNSPIGRRVAFSVPPSRTWKKKPDIQTTVHTVETSGRVQDRQTCQYDCILARYGACVIPKLERLSALIFTCFFHTVYGFHCWKSHSQHCSLQRFQLSETLLQM